MCPTDRSGSTGDRAPRFADGHGEGERAGRNVRPFRRAERGQGLVQRSVLVQGTVGA